MKNVKVAILGMGTVGGGIYQLIEQEGKNIEHKDGIRLEVKKTLALSYAVDVPEEKKAGNIDEIVSDPEISIVAEVMGGQHPSKEFILKALEAGKTAVSYTHLDVYKRQPIHPAALRSRFSTTQALPQDVNAVSMPVFHPFCFRHYLEPRHFLAMSI